MPEIFGKILPNDFLVLFFLGGGDSLAGGTPHPAGGSAECMGRLSSQAASKSDIGDSQKINLLF